MAKKTIKIAADRKLQEQLLTIRYKYMSNGKKALVSKDEMRKNGVKSPDRADALAMAVYFKDELLNEAKVASNSQPDSYPMEEAI